MPSTKIVCTLGPATSEPETLRRMVGAGMDLARINLSHGDRPQHRLLLENVREAARAEGMQIPILLDLQGPKIRVGKLEETLNLFPSDRLVFAPETEASGDEVPTTYAHLAKDLQPGHTILLDDGALELTCIETRGTRAEMEVIRGGPLQSRKGMNLPGIRIREPSLTKKDLEDMEFALEVGAEFIGLSFVRGPQDILELRDRVGSRARIVAKIEKLEALDFIEEITEVTDVIMVARGDLGVELPFEQVPMAQKRIIQLANYCARPVITATQMLESMIEEPRPTRAEASDVANAILDGTDAVMLSGETAVGKHPVRALEALVAIAEEIDRSGALSHGPHYTPGSASMRRCGASNEEHSVAAGSVESARLLGAPAMIVITSAGFAPQLVSSYRPTVPVFAVCTDETVFRQLGLVWGVKPVLAAVEDATYENLCEFGKQAVIDAGIGRPGDSVVVTSGYPFRTARTTNTMRVEQI